ncbi:MULTISPECIES: hypothetical protein [unclassified Ornithinimicrobium]|uniref:hypothetical protein n=1 Tax=unclassified Ornithinimicrobium TaxID=2615080 RepID=UPI003852DCD6
MNARLRGAPLLLVPGGLALLTGLDAALTLAGLPAPAGSPSLAVLHGPLMVMGFLGTVIALERAVALRQPWGLLVLVLVYVALHQRNSDPVVAVEGLGAVLAAAAALLMTRVDVLVTVPLLIAFVVLTIGAERVELARLAMPRDATTTLTGFSVLVAGAAVAATLWPTTGGRALGGVLLLLTLWLVRHDVARRLVRSSGLPRFAAAALLAGYLWLAVAATTLLLVGRPVGAAYDVVVHATFLGFAMSMVLARVLGAALEAVRLWEGALVRNVAALLLFVLTAAATAVSATRPGTRRTRPLPEVTR